MTAAFLLGKREKGFRRGALAHRSWAYVCPQSIALQRVEREVEGQHVNPRFAEKAEQRAPRFASTSVRNRSSGSPRALATRATWSSA